jgi:hypothetical protein
MQHSVEFSVPDNVQNKDNQHPYHRHLTPALSGRMSHRQSNPSFGSSDLSSSIGDPVTPPDSKGFTGPGIGIALVSSSSSSSSMSGHTGTTFSTTSASLYPGSNDHMSGYSNHHHHSLSISSTFSDANQHGLYQTAPSSLPIGIIVPNSTAPTTFPSALPSPAVTSVNLPTITPPSDYKYSGKFNTNGSFNLSPIASAAGTRDDYLVRDMSRIHLGKSGRSDSFPPSPGSRFLFDSGSLPSNASLGEHVNSLTPPPSSHKRMPSYLQAETTDDKFPILVRRESATFTPAGASTPRAPFVGSNGFTSEAVFDMLDPSPILIESATWSSAPQQPILQAQHMSRGSNGSLGLSGYSAGVSANIDPDPTRYYAHHSTVDQYQSQNLKASLDISPASAHSPSSVYRNSYFVPYVQSTANAGLHMRSDSGSQIPPSPLPVTIPHAEEFASLSNNNVAVPQHTQPPPTQQSTTSHGGSKTGRHTAPANGHGAKPARENNRRQNSKRSEQEASSRFSQASLESLVHEVYTLCKDQDGCRFLQKKLEEKNPTYLNIIFNETCPHVVELMTDPFGNYLCQKLLEHANDEQRTELIRTAAPSLVKIALNQHGTRALQKMIEFVSTPEQVDMIVNALKANVVKLIKDLNGNHVVQKCLNRLQSDGSQFIFDAVSKNCVVVGSHRHGCCVLQRCIDHASDAQRKQLVKEITSNAFTLVQDPFGNYVTQYVLDLGSKEFSEPLIRQFVGNACMLSMQKFSSNVIEKCLRIAEPETANMLIEELVDTPYLDKLLRDSYANYVIQTALDYAEAGTRQRLVDNIRPIIPSIRSTPYGRRIQSKLSTSGSSAQGGINNPSDGNNAGDHQQMPFNGQTSSPNMSGLVDWGNNASTLY